MRGSSLIAAGAILPAARGTAENGTRVIRVWNKDVPGNLAGVPEMPSSELLMQPLTPTLSPQAGRGSASKYAP